MLQVVMYRRLCCVNAFMNASMKTSHVIAECENGRKQLLQTECNTLASANIYITNCMYFILVSSEFNNINYRWLNLISIFYARVKCSVLLWCYRQSATWQTN